MKQIITLLCCITVLQLSAQKTITPATVTVQKKWIHNQQYTMKWFMLLDTARYEMATVQTDISLQAATVTVVTQVQMKGMKQPWIDTTVAKKRNLAPVYHSSYNMQREMVLRYGPVVTGSYIDLMKKKNSSINDTVTGNYFDSNLYPVLTGWLPLQDAYTATLQLYDYNPNGKTGLLKAFVTQVRSGTYASTKEGDRAVWLVTVRDEMGGGENGESVYYFDKQDRRLWKQEINAGGRKMEMVRVE